MKVPGRRSLKTTTTVSRWPTPESGWNQTVSPRTDVSIGVASFPDDAGDPEALVRSADAALYRAKAGGRDCVVLSS